jgi:putative ATP-dependent endonuclease of OLD family
MLLHSVCVKNFRSLFDTEIIFESVTALVGPNGTGKSAFLHALNLFYSPVPKIEVQDFYGGKATSELVVSVTYKSLGDDAKQLFASYMEGDQLTVERVFTFNDGRISQKYHGSALQNTEFQGVRAGFEVKDRGKTAREAYDALRSRTKYSPLPAWTNLAQATENLKAWELANPGQCSKQRDDGQFFGFEKVAQGYLGRFTKFLFIPAVREAADDASEGRNSVFSTLMDLVVRSILAKKQELVELRARSQQEYETILAPENLKELGMLANRVTETLKTYVPTASVEMEWQPLDDLDIPLPKANVKLVEDGYSCPVSRTGHGLQRAFILTMLQHLALAQNNAAQSTGAASQANVTQPASGAASSGLNATAQPSGAALQSPLDEKLPNLLLAIEEPELFQHPNRQRHLAMIFQTLASGSTPGVAQNTQIVLATHSPLFIAIDHASQIRLLRKCANGEGNPKITRVVHTDLNVIARKVWEVNGSIGTTFTGATLVPRLKTIMTPWMSEGFFSDVAVLVEGEDDRAAILGVAKALGHDLESMGCSIIPCGGKNNLDRPSIIFRELGIPVYIVWDGDKGTKDANPADNHVMLRLVGQPTKDWPDTQVNGSYACFESSLESIIQKEIGDKLFDETLAACQKTFGFPKKKHAIKNPLIIAAIIEEAKKQGKTSLVLEQIVKCVVALRGILL